MTGKTGPSEWAKYYWTIAGVFATVCFGVVAATTDFAGLLKEGKTPPSLSPPAHSQSSWMPPPTQTEGPGNQSGQNSGPMSGEACLPGIWRLQAETVYLAHESGQYIQSSLDGPGYLMTLTRSHNGKIDFGGGLWRRGMLGESVLQAKTVGTAQFRWSVSADVFLFENMSGTGTETTYQDGKSTGAGRYAPTDASGAYSCIGDNLRISGENFSYEYVRIGG